MLIEFLTNPWVIIIIVVSIIVGNIAALKYTANYNHDAATKRNQDLDRLTELDARRRQKMNQAGHRPTQEPDKDSEQQN